MANEERVWLQPALTAGGVLLGAFIGGLFTFLATYTTVQSNLDEQARSFAQDERRATQATREEVYRGFLEAANEYAFAAAAMGPFIQGCYVDQRCEATEELFTYMDARSSYQGALNDVYVYGSDDAVTAAGALSESLPPALATPHEPIELGDVDSDGFTSGYQEFLDLMCREATPDPRAGC